MISAYSLAHVARLAQSAGIPLRILDRTAGEPLMLAHRTQDGRTVTPTMVLWRNGRDVGAWVDVPSELQQMFFSMSTNPETRGDSRSGTCGTSPTAASLC